jgi:hypothetical protein
VPRLYACAASLNKWMGSPIKKKYIEILIKLPQLVDQIEVEVCSYALEKYGRK